MVGPLLEIFYIRVGQTVLRGDGQAVVSPSVIIHGEYCSEVVEECEYFFIFPCA